MIPVAALVLPLSGCDGMFHGIYDEPSAEVGKQYGFVSTDIVTNTGTIYIDATDYTQWHYIDLDGKVVTSTAIDTVLAPAEWDFALHRYDAKTNGGAVVETEAVDFESLPQLSSIPNDQFVPDEWTTDRIIVDMSQMMDGVINYASDYYNSELSLWLDVDKSVMPPVYTLSGRVYILRLRDGRYAALRLTNFMSDAAVKGFMTIEYKYPLGL